MGPRVEEKEGLKPRDEGQMIRFQIAKREERINPSRLVHVTDSVHLKLKP